MKKLLFVSAILMLLSQLSFGSSKQHIDQIADDYFATKALPLKMIPKIAPKALFSLAPGIQVPPASGQTFDNFNCQPNSQSCISVACERLGHFGCDDMSEVQAVAKACRGNFGSECLKVSCDLAGHFGCDDLDEVSTLAKACTGNHDGECVKFVCEKLGHFGCDDIDEIEAVAQSCGGQ